MELYNSLINLFAFTGLVAFTWLLIRTATAVRYKLIMKQWPKTQAEQQISLLDERCSMLKDENEALKEELKKVTLLVLDRLQTH